MKYICVNDKFLYCNGEPNWEENKEYPDFSDEEYNIPIGCGCKLNPKTCKKSQTQKQSLKARDGRIKNAAK